MTFLLLACWPNTPPSAVDFEITPTEPSASDDLTATITVEPLDADGDQFTVRYRWYRDGFQVEGADSATLSSELTSTHELWRCEAVAFDGTDEGVVVTHSVTIDNSLPVLEFVEIAPADPRSDQDLVAVWDATDADGDELDERFVWKRDGVVESGLDTEVVPAEYTIRGEIWILELTVRDQNVNGVTGSAVATIDNGQPTVTVTIGPGDAKTTDNIVATTSSDDVDGDTVTLSYTWFVDGNERVDFGSGAAAPWTVTEKGDSVQVEVVPNDGEVDGDAVLSDALVVQNTPPTVQDDYAYISPTIPTESSTLSCVGVFLDDDDDPIGWQTRWFIQGSEVSSNATLKDVFVSGDEVYCGLTPDDGEELGEEVFSSTTTIY